MSEDLFDDPGGNAIDWEDYLGKLLIIWPFGTEVIKTADYGEKEATRADMVLLDGANGPEDIPDVLVFPLVLQGQLKRNRNSGRPIVGRLGQGDPKLDSRGKETQKPPWKLLPATDADKVAATKYLEEKKAKPKPEPDHKFDDVPF